MARTRHRGGTAGGVSRGGGTAALVPVPRRSSRLADAGGNRKDHVVKKNGGSKRSPQPAGDSPSQASAQSSPSLNQCQSPQQSSSHSLSSPPKPSPRYSLPSQTTSSLPQKPAYRPPFLLPTPLSNPLLPISAFSRISLFLSLLLSMFLTLSLGY